MVKFQPQQFHLNILRHLCRYRLSFKPVLLKKFFGGSEDHFEKTIGKMSELIATVPLSEGSGSIRYYQLTRKGAALVGCSLERAKALDPGSVYDNLAVLWFCFMGPVERRRMENNDVAEHFGKSYKASFCLERASKSEEVPKLYRVFVPGDETPEKTILSQVQKHLSEVSDLTPTRHKSYKVSHMMKEGSYKAAILVTSDARRDKLREYFKKAKEQLTAHFVIETVPDPLTMRAAISAGKARSKQRQEVSPDELTQQQLPSVSPPPVKRNKPARSPLHRKGPRQT